MKDIDIAWAAGLFEGEGCISFESKNSVRLTIEISDEKTRQIMPVRALPTDWATRGSGCQ